jgi:hypothetical protein
MKQYAEESSGKTGIAKKDVMLIADEYGGDYDDVNLAMAEAMNIMAKNCITYLS